MFACLDTYFIQLWKSCCFTLLNKCWNQPGHVFLGLAGLTQVLHNNRLIRYTLFCCVLQLLKKKTTAAEIGTTLYIFLSQVVYDFGTKSTLLHKTFLQCMEVAKIFTASVATCYRRYSLLSPQPQFLLLQHTAQCSESNVKEFFTTCKSPWWEILSEPIVMTVTGIENILSGISYGVLSILPAMVNTLPYIL